MIKRKEEMSVSFRNMRGGNGEIKFDNHLETTEVPHGRLFSTITGEKGKSTG